MKVAGFAHSAGIHDAMVERVFIRRLLFRYLDRVEPNAFYYKIPDGFALTPIGRRWAVNRPFDLIVIVDGEIYCWEVKRITRKPKTIAPLVLLKQHQYESLREAQDAGAHVGIILEIDEGERIECYWLPVVVGRHKFDKVAKRLFVAKCVYEGRWMITWCNDEGVQGLK